MLGAGYKQKQVCALLRTYTVDREWLPYSLRSIEKFMFPTISSLTVVYPAGEESMFREILDEFPWTLTRTTRHDEMMSRLMKMYYSHSYYCATRGCSVGYAAQIVDKMHADQFVPRTCQYIIYIDTDSVATRQYGASDIFDAYGKSRFPYRLWSTLPKDAIRAWKASTAKALTMKLQALGQSFMCRQGLVYPIEMFKQLREFFHNAHNMSVMKYVSREAAHMKVCSEFEVMGAYLWYHMHDVIAWEPLSSFPILQLRGWDGFTPKARRQFECVLGETYVGHVWTPLTKRNGSAGRCLLTHSG